MLDVADFRPNPKAPQLGMFGPTTLTSGGRERLQAARIAVRRRTANARRPALDEELRLRDHLVSCATALTPCTARAPDRRAY